MLGRTIACLAAAFACAMPGAIVAALAQTKVTIVTFAGATNLPVWLA